jgi:hypothetical protein
VDNLGRTEPKLQTLVSELDFGSETISPLKTLGQPHRPPIRKRSRSKPSSWPTLERLGLSDGQKASRLRGIGGSDANVILSGDQTRVLDLWREKRGERNPEDLSGKLAVVLGSWTEQFNRQWYEKLTGNPVSRVGQEFVSAQLPWRRCTLDGFLEIPQSIWEAKHTSPFVTLDQVLERYMPQLQHGMAVMGVSKAVLSIIYGNQKFEVIEIASDWLYQQELFEAERHFWDCVQTGKEPVVVDPPPPPKPVGTREVSFEGNNAWASAAGDWRQYREAAKLHAASCGLVKSLIEEDVVRAFGHGIEAKRSRSGAITIRELT